MYERDVIDIAGRPVAALVAGLQAPRDIIMGHAGALLCPGESDAKRKAKLLQDAGAVLVYHPSQFGEIMASLLADDHMTDTPVSRKPTLAPRVG